METDGSRRALCDASNPLSRSKLDRFFFENQLTEQDAARINRRYLVPDSVMVSSEVIPACIILHLKHSTFSVLKLVLKVYLSKLHK
eukprot:SAG11_NODE_20091_length_452_cov_12.348442_2_plen_85_part_01